MPAERPFQHPEGWPHGAASASAGGTSDDTVGDGENRETGLGALPDPASSLLSVSE